MVFMLPMEFLAPSSDDELEFSDQIKSYLVNPPVVIPPHQEKPFRLYLSTDGMVISSALIQEFEGK